MQRLTVGQFSRLCGLAPRTLRFYADVGLLTPRFVDDASGYRFYSPDQVDVARGVAVLRAMHCPLRELRRFVHASGEGRARDVLRDWRDELLVRAELARAHAARLDALIALQEDHVYDIEVKEIASQRALVVRRHIDDASQAGRTVVDAFNGALWPFVERRALDVRPPSFFACHDEPGDAGPATVEVGVPVHGDVRADAGVTVEDVPGGRFACTLHAGGYDAMHAAYEALLAWARSNDVRLDPVTREVYLVDYRSTDDEAELRTEVMYRLSDRAE